MTVLVVHWIIIVATVVWVLIERKIRRDEQKSADRIVRVMVADLEGSCERLSVGGDVLVEDESSRRLQRSIVVVRGRLFDTVYLLQLFDGESSASAARALGYFEDRKQNLRRFLFLLEIASIRMKRRKGTEWALVRQGLDKLIMELQTLENQESEERLEMPTTEAISSLGGLVMPATPVAGGEPESAPKVQAKAES